jgi:hypothetical protein
MRFYDVVETPLSEKTFLEPSLDRIPQTDARVASWFQPLPEGHQRAYNLEGLPFNVLIPEPVDTRTYAEKRKAKYDLLNQDEMRYDDLVNSTTTWPDAIAAIKAEFPK